MLLPQNKLKLLLQPQHKLKLLLPQQNLLLQSKHKLKLLLQPKHKLNLMMLPQHKLKLLLQPQHKLKLLLQPQYKLKLLLPQQNLLLQSKLKLLLHFYPFSSIKNLQLKKSVFFFLLPIRMHIMNHLKCIFSNIFAFWIDIKHIKAFFKQPKVLPQDFRCTFLPVFLY